MLIRVKRKRIGRMLYFDFYYEYDGNHNDFVSLFGSGSLL